MTAVNLLLTFALLIWNEGKPNSRFWILFIVTFFIGFFSEVVGVNTGLLFGSYAYINHLGPKIWDVPLLIGINWFCVVYCSIVFVQSVLSVQNLNPVLSALGAALIATIFDWVMEPIAMVFDYWKWENEHIPFYNYVCWFCISFLIALIFINVQRQCKNRFAIPLLMIQFIFFVALRVLLD
jgi:putative membrane protein